MEEVVQAAIGKSGLMELVDSNAYAPLPFQR